MRAGSSPPMARASVSSVDVAMPHARRRRGIHCAGIHSKQPAAPAQSAGGAERTQIPDDTGRRSSQPMVSLSKIRPYCKLVYCPSAMPRNPPDAARETACRLTIDGSESKRVTGCPHHGAGDRAVRGEKPGAEVTARTGKKEQEETGHRVLSPDRRKDAVESSGSASTGAPAGMVPGIPLAGCETVAPCVRLAARWALYNGRRLSGAVAGRCHPGNRGRGGT